MSDVEDRYTVVVSIITGGIGTNKYNGQFIYPSNSVPAPNGCINIPFKPDEMIVRQITYTSSAAAGVESYNTYLIWMDAINNYIGHFTEGLSICPRSHHRLPPSFNPQQLRFKILASDQVTIKSDLTGDLAITLEFVKYRPLG